MAPSPTGALHLGNARTFLINWALARQLGWRIVLRIDDLDGPRVKQGADGESIEVLEWLGCDWDEGPFYQTRQMADYRKALEHLAGAGLIYPCRCTRSDIQAAQSAPHATDHELRYPGTCRPPRPVAFEPGQLDDAQTTWRLRVPNEPHVHVDRFAGQITTRVRQSVGDFAVATKNRQPSYQLAVVVDDHHQQVTEIVRGDDLLSSVARQDLVSRSLGWASDESKSYWHLPLVVGPDGRRLAKRHGDSRLVHYRATGVSAARIVGLVASWSGCGPRRDMTSDEFLDQFRIERLATDPVVFSREDERWLRG